MLILEQFIGFDWDEGNKGKNWDKQRVSDSECEQVFFNQPLLIFPDEEHSEEEQRYYVFGSNRPGLASICGLHSPKRQDSRHFCKGDDEARKGVLSTMKTKQIPAFTSEEGEREFWANHDATDFIDFSQAKRALMPNLRPTLKRVSIRLPESLLESIRVLAHKRDVPYQSLMKMLLVEGIERELYAQRK